MLVDRRHRAGLPPLTDADKLRNVLHELGMSQRGAARRLEISERQMRRYCAGHDVPKYVLLALLGLAGRLGAEISDSHGGTPAGAAAEPPDPAAPG